MLNRKLLEILRHLQPEEIKNLRLFLLSPYFTYGMSKDILSLFDLIMRHGADETSPELEKKRLNERFFPEKPFQENKKNPIDNLASSLLSLTKKFLFIQAAETNTSAAMKELEVARFYMKHSLEERFLASEQHIRELLQQCRRAGESLFMEYYHLENLVATFSALFSGPEKNSASQVSKANALDRFYITVRAELFCLMAHQMEITALDALKQQAQLTAQIRQIAWTENNVADLYWMVLDIFQNPFDFSAVKKFEARLYEQQEATNSNHLQYFMAFLRIFYMKWVQQSDQKERWVQYFQLTIQQLEAGYLYHEGKIFSFSLRNITRTGLRIGAYDQVLEILKNHPPERIGGTLYPREIYHLNLSFYYFATKEYALAEQFLAYCDFKDINFNFQAEITRIKILYETGSPLVESRINALQQRIRRSVLSKNIKEKYDLMLRKVLQLQLYGWDKNNPKRARLAESVRKTPGMLEKEWLLSHLE
jgi:hypothetical protein